VLETFPDACFVWTHRDPARLLPSLCSLVAGWRSLYEGAVDERAIGRWQLEMWCELVMGGIAKRRLADPGRFCDLSFQEVARDPLAAVRRIYRHFGFELGPEAERRMREWQAANPQGKHGGHAYSAERFGLSEDEIDERFAAYREHFGVAKEPASGGPAR
jgi:hypothetical protein